jgi:hypothetical protein
MTYARYLIENDYEDKITELCNNLLGPLYSLNWNQMILIYKKRDLLKDILPLMAQNLSFQRLQSFYKQQLSLMANFSQKSSVLDRLVTNSTSSSIQKHDSYARSKNFDFSRPLCQTNTTSTTNTKAISNESMAIEDDSVEQGQTISDQVIKTTNGMENQEKQKVESPDIETEEKSPNPVNNREEEELKQVMITE